jgi:hypothetical protein
MLRPLLVVFVAAAAAIVPSGHLSLPALAEVSRLYAEHLETCVANHTGAPPQSAKQFVLHWRALNILRWEPRGWNTGW